MTHRFSLITHPYLTKIHLNLKTTPNLKKNPKKNLKNSIKNSIKKLKKINKKKKKIMTDNK
jgi:DNA-directed RNA polymerase subunit L